MWKQIGVAIIASWLPISGFATEPASNMDPEIKGSLDGEPREWFILSHGNDSNASFVELGDDINIEITGFTDNESWESQEALLISLIVRGDQLISSDVIHLIGESPSPPLYTSDGAEVTVSLSHYERDGPRVHVAGKIHGMLALQVQLDEPPSAEEGIEIDVEFEVEAQKVEF